MSTIVIMPGGFHPFHAGHYALYKSAVEAFPNAEVYVAATNDQKERPFPFSIKEKLAKIAGVAPGHFVQVKSPFKPSEITDRLNPEQDIVIFVRSEKDKTEQPKPGGTRKDGTPAYFQPLGKKLAPFGQHAYIAYLPTVQFGPGMTSATQIRTSWPHLDTMKKSALVMTLYPRLKNNGKMIHTVVGLLDSAIGAPVVTNEDELDEDLSRRGFLRGAGAVAGAAAAGGAGVFLYGAAKSANEEDKRFISHLTDPEDLARYKKLCNTYAMYAGLSANPNTPVYKLMATNALTAISYFRKEMYKKYNFQPGQDKISEEAMTADTIREGSKVETSKGLGIVRLIFSDGTASVRLQDGTRARFKISQLEAYHPEFNESSTETKSKPVKPFSQVHQFPLNSLLTGHGDGSALKADPAYKRDIRRNKQVADQRKVVADKVKAGYQSNNEEDWDTLSEDVKHRLASAALAAGLVLNPASGVVLNPARVIGPQGQTVADPYKKAKPTPRQADDIVDTEQKNKHHSKTGK